MNNHFIGVLLYNSSNNSIIGDNVISNNGNGVSILRANTNNRISGNSIKQNYRGILLDGVGFYSRNLNNMIRENDISDNRGYGIDIDFSDQNYIFNNTICYNELCGIYAPHYRVAENIIAWNTITNNNEIGINLDGWYNNIFGNTIANHSSYGIYLDDNSWNDNVIYHNNFINNTQNAYTKDDNIWNLGYPFGGNYWDSHPDFTDNFSGPDQNESGSDGICDSPYDIPKDNQDIYPLINESEGNIPLISEAYGPYFCFAGNGINFKGDGFGGVPPYTYLWDFGEGNISTLKNPQQYFYEEGIYTVNLTITDSENTRVNDTTQVQVTGDPLEADAGGTYYGVVNESVQFFGNATGGFPPYSWFWSFAGTGYAYEQNPQHVFTRADNYSVYFKVTDKGGFDDADWATVVINESVPPEDDIPPNITITKPIHAIYIRNKMIFQFFTTVVIGKIDIEVSAVDNGSGMDCVEFYIDDELLAIDNTTPYTILWDERSFNNFKHTLKVVAIDLEDNSACAEIDVWKFF